MNGIFNFGGLGLPQGKRGREKYLFNNEVEMLANNL